MWSSVRLAGRWRQAFLAGLLALGACAQHRQPAFTAPPPPPVPVQPARPTQPVLPREQVQNKIALLVPLTGPNGTVGRSIANAATLALTDVGKSSINLRIYDTGAGIDAATRKALADGARLILGPLLAAETKVASVAVAGRGIPVLSFSNDANLASREVYVLGYQPAQAIARVVGYARSVGVERFAGLIPAGVYGQRAGTAFLRTVEAAGGRVVVVANYTHTPAGMAAAIRTVAGPPRIAVTSPAAARFDALLIADAPASSATVARDLAHAGLVTRLLGTELWATDPIIIATPALRGALFAAVPEARFRQFEARYRARYAATPSRLASFGYDGVLLANAIGTGWALGAPFPDAALRSAAGFEGVNGRFRFVDGIAERQLEVREAAAGASRVVSPAAAGFGTQP